MLRAIQPNLDAKRLGLILGLAVCGLVLTLPPTKDLPISAIRCAAVATLMAIWWVTEAIPLPATALLPLILFPILEIRSTDEVAAPYADPLIYLFLGGFLLAAAVERWNLHRRFALSVLALVGSSPRRILLGFLLATAFISMWVSNTATTMLIIPIALSIPPLVTEGNRSETENLSAAIGLAVAYGSTVGGLGTIIGTPPNAFFVSFIREQYGMHIGFGQWMLIGVPLVLAGLCLVYPVLLWMHPLSTVPLEGGGSHIREELRRMGRLSRPEAIVLSVFILTAIAWVAGPLVRKAVPDLSDTGIALTAALALFIIPAHRGARGSLLRWEDAERIPWGVLLIFGGGLSLADAIQKTGLASYVGSLLRVTSALPTLALILIIAFLVLLVTELASNIAAAATFMPIVALLAHTRGENPLLLTLPTVLMASCGFMLPVGTPPNAIVFGSKMVTQAQMIRTGAVLNLLFLFLITLLPYVLVPLVFNTP